jgi:putative ABC transport system permease protein
MKRRASGDRAYHWMLRLFPAEFRSEFGHEMRADFRDELDDARDRGLMAVAALWWRTVPRLILTAARAWLDDGLDDTRFAFRMMKRGPGFAVAAVLMLALGTGANAAMFSVIDAVMLQTPFSDQDRIALVGEQATAPTPTHGIPTTQLETLAGFPEFQAVAAFGSAGPVVTGLGEPHRLNLECVSAAMFQVLGTPPLLGRSFAMDEDRPGADAVIVVSHRLWQSELGGSQAALGSTLTLDGTRATIVGVMPPRFNGPLSRSRVDGWVPIGPSLNRKGPLDCNARSTVNVFVRARAPLTPASAETQINRSGSLEGLRLANGAPVSRIELTSIDDQTFYELRTPFFALLGAVACVLLIACANVANLQLERLVGRRREVAVRLALGASRSRVVRQTLAENLVLSVLGAVAGLLAARLTLGLLVGLLPLYIPHLADIALNGCILAATLALSVLAGLAVGLIPAVQATSPRLVDDLKDTARTTARAGRWTRRVLVVVELALSIVLLVGAALMIRTFLTLRPSQPGFDPSNKVTATVLLPGAWVPDPGHQVFFDAVFDRLKGLPGVASVSGSTYVPLAGWVSMLPVGINGVTANVWTGQVTPNYFRDMRIAISRGRAFEPTDDGRAPAVAIVNEAMARRFWPNAEPLGRMVQTTAPNGTAVTSRRIIGIVRNTRSLGGNTDSKSELYWPYAQDPGPFLFLIVRTAGPPDAALPSSIRAAVAAVRPGQVVDAIKTLQDTVDQSVTTPRFGAWLFGVFAAMAVGLAALGLAAVIAWWVTQRTREIGVRMALGASRTQVASLIVRQGFGLAVVGVVLGLAVAAACTRVLAGWLYGVTPLDGWTFASCGALMLAIAAFASYLPALRATRIDPIVALRAE